MSKKQLVKYKWDKRKQAQHCPFEPNPIHYGVKSDHIIHEDNSPKLDGTGKKNIQQVLGSFLYYARAVDCTILTALNAIATEQVNPTEKTLTRVHQFLDYMATHPYSR